MRTAHLPCRVIARVYWDNFYEIALLITTGRLIEKSVVILCLITDSVHTTSVPAALSTVPTLVVFIHPLASGESGLIQADIVAASVSSLISFETLASKWQLPAPLVCQRYSFPAVNVYVALFERRPQLTLRMVHPSSLPTVILLQASTQDWVAILLVLNLHTCPAWRVCASACGGAIWLNWIHSKKLF